MLQTNILTSTLAGQYIIFGVVAQFFITFLYIFSTPWFIRKTGYEFFKKSHTLIAILYMGACVGHWYQLYAWLLAAFILTMGDFAIRGLRTLLLHGGYGTKKSLSSFECAKATVQRFGDESDEAVRVDFEFEHSAWQPGQHFFLCFPALGIWQSHPFTPCSVPKPGEKVQQHTYLIRTHAGITKRLAKIAGDAGGQCEMNVIVTGPYGASTVAPHTHSKLFVAGGTGVTSVLPSLQLALASSQISQTAHAIDLTWIIRKSQDLLWLAPELTAIKSQLAKESQTSAHVHIFVTREASALTPTHSSSVSITSSSSHSHSADSASSDSENEKKEASTTTRPLVSANILADLLAPCPSFEITHLNNAHPALSEIVAAFAERAALVDESVSVLAAGPAAMGTDLRREVAGRNCAKEVWKGRKGQAWEMEWDCRS
jgi:NAD(P)H-flavin reductase